MEKQIKISLTLSRKGFYLNREETSGILQIEELNRYKVLETEKYKIEMEYEPSYNHTQNVYNVEIIIDEEKKVIILYINKDKSILPIETFVVYLDEELFFNIKRKK